MKSESEVPVHEEFTYICGAVTQILKCGPWKDLSKYEGAPKVLFLVIPGNPGLPSFYQLFIKTLYSCLNRQYPVWVVGHAGHCRIPDGMKMTEETAANELDDVFGLRGQIEHKLSFLQKNVPKDVKVVLIGHSIGAYIGIEIMKHAKDLEIIRSMLLFPTVERMAQSPIGKIVTPLVTWLRYIVYVPIYLAFLLPESIRQYMMHFGATSILSMDESSKMFLKDLSFGCAANIFYLASQEMRNVRERDNTAIRQHLKKLTFYYGVGDKWCPLQYYEEMKRDFPDGDIQLCEKGIQHAFVLDSGKEMAEILADWLQEDLARL